MVRRSVREEGGHSTRQMELLKTSCAQRIEAGAGSITKAASCRRKSWLSSGLSIIRWRVNPTGLRYRYVVVCTIVIRAMSDLSGIAAGLVGLRLSSEFISETIASLAILSASCLRWKAARNRSECLVWNSAKGREETSARFR